MKKLLTIMVLGLFLSSNAYAGFILEKCKKIDNNISLKNTIFVVSTRGEQRILELEHNPKIRDTKLIIYNLETYNFDIAKGTSLNAKAEIVIDANKKTIEITYPSGNIFRYKCSKLK